MKSNWRILTTLLCGIFSITCQSSLTKGQSNTKNDTMNMNKDKIDTAVIAGGCFWCLDAVYREMKGVLEVESGYSNGHVLNPDYEAVCSGITGHAEVVKITFDTSQTSYEDILTVFWRIHDPTTLNRQGNDVGTQYRSGIYYRNESQKIIAEKSKEAAEASGIWKGKIVTEIKPLSNYSKAEEYHQDYYRNNPNNRYCTYVVGEKVEKFKKLFKEKLKEK